MVTVADSVVVAVEVGVRTKVSIGVDVNPCAEANVRVDKETMIRNTKIRTATRDFFNRVFIAKILPFNAGCLSKIKPVQLLFLFPPVWHDPR